MIPAGYKAPVRRNKALFGEQKDLPRKGGGLENVGHHSSHQAMEVVACVKFQPIVVKYSAYFLKT